MPDTILDHLFPNPNTPDLGCFVRRKHEREVSAWGFHTELNPSIDFHPTYHQLYFRVKCGKAAFYQKCTVHMVTTTNTFPQGFPPDWVLGGDFTPRPSDWQKYPVQTGERYYWFFGYHRNPAGDFWASDRFVGHSYDIYENGTLSTVYFDDTGGDQDLNDFILEVAVVGRQFLKVVFEDVAQITIDERIAKEAMSALHKRVYRPDEGK
jgi:hypothetical protein